MTWIEFLVVVILALLIIVVVSMLLASGSPASAVSGLLVGAVWSKL